MPWSNYAKDRFFFPKLSLLTACGAPALMVTPRDSASWLASFILNSALRVQIPDPVRQLMFTYLRRVDSAVLEYGRGREALSEFLQQNKGVISQFSRCLYAFESAVSMTHQGYLLARQLIPGKPLLFKKDDRSVLNRMDKVYNASKHADEFIANGNRFAPRSTSTVWITNDGLESRNASLTFAELAHAIEEISGLAAKLANLDPPAPASDDASTPAD